MSDLDPRSTPPTVASPVPPALRIEPDDLIRPAVHALLHEHLANMHALTPAEHVFALDLDALRAPEISVWTVWSALAHEPGLLLGCGALKALGPAAGEVKSMRTPAAQRRRGAGRALLAHIVDVARQRGYETLHLETGTGAAFEPAHALYRSAGFVPCGAFGSYRENPHSAFMTLRLG